MKERHLGLVGAVSALALWACGSAWAQAAAPDAFPSGALAPQLAEQVQAIVQAQVKASLPAAEEGVTSVTNMDKGKTVSAKIDGEEYTGSVYRPFRVEQTAEGKVQADEFFVRTTAAWKFKDGAAAPADTYFSQLNDRVLAFNAAQVGAQDAALANNKAMSDAALAQVEEDRKAQAAATPQTYQDQLDKLTANITQLSSDATDKETVRTAANAQLQADLQRNAAADQRLEARRAWNGQLPPPPAFTGKGADGKLLWAYQGGRMTFYDGLDKTLQDLQAARSEQSALQAKATAGQTAASALYSGKAQAVRAVATRERKRILVGEKVGESDMRADYEAALGAPLKSPPASDTGTAAPAASNSGAGATLAPNSGTGAAAPASQ